MFELVIGFIVATILFIAEYLLCTKLKSPLWGGIIPVLILAGTIWIFAVSKSIRESTANPLINAENGSSSFWSLNSIF